MVGGKKVREFPSERDKNLHRNEQRWGTNSKNKCVFMFLTQRAVRGMPSLSFSSGSSMPRATASSRLLSAMMGKGSEQQADSSQL